VASIVRHSLLVVAFCVIGSGLICALARIKSTCAQSIVSPTTAPDCVPKPSTPFASVPALDDNFCTAIVAVGGAPASGGHSVHTPDHRCVMSTTLPAICCIETLDGEGNTIGMGTGFFIPDDPANPNGATTHAIVTAAHLLDPNIGNAFHPASSVKVYPAMNGSFPEALPVFAFGPFPQWIKGGGAPADDIGVVTLKNPYTVTTMRLATFKPATHTTGMICGYPSLASPRPNPFSPLHQYYDNDIFLGFCPRGLLFYWMDTSDGQSGSPVISGGDGSPANPYQVIAMHTNGGAVRSILPGPDGAGHNYNFGVIFTPPAQKEIERLLLRQTRSGLGK
jgi:hypothetical protein